MSRTTRTNIDCETNKLEKTRDNKPRCQCCCNPRRSKYGNKKEKLTIQERKEALTMKKNIHCINPNCFDDNCHGTCESKDIDVNEEHWEGLARDFSLKKEESGQEDS